MNIFIKTDSILNCKPLIDKLSPDKVKKNHTNNVKM